MAVLTSHPRQNRKTRVAHLVYMLATNQTVRSDELCERFRISRRTFARYIADVRDAGFEVVYSEAQDTYRLNRVRFNGSSPTGP